MYVKRFAPGPSKFASQPIKCGLCGKGIVAGLTFAGKPAKQAMTTVMGIDLASTRRRHIVTGRIHIDRELCKALEKVSDEKLERSSFASLQETQEWRGNDGGDGNVLHPVADVGMDQDGDEQ